MILLDVTDTVLAWLLTNYPILLLVVAVSFATYWITNQVNKFNTRFKKTEDQCDDLRDKFVPDLHKKVSNIDNKLGQLILTVGKISTHIITKQGLDAHIFAANSPIELTELGVKILTEVGGKKYVDDNLESLIKEIEVKEPKSGLDVQTFSNAILTYKTTEDGFIHIKNFIFQNPIYQVNDSTAKLSIDIGMVTQIMGIYLRNKYFERYPDLKKDL